MKVLLTVLPYWAPVLPPVGLARLKAYLEPHGYDVRVVDFIIRHESLEFYYNYFNILKECIPPEKRGNFKNIGHDVLRNHMIAHLHNTGEPAYIALVQELIYKTYYVRVEASYVHRLDETIAGYYQLIKEFFLFTIEFEEPEVVGATVYRDNLGPTFFLLKLLRKHFPHIKTIIGGGLFADSHAQGSPNFDDLLEKTQDYVDNIIIGEGEILLHKYLQGQLPPDQRVYTAADAGGEVLDLSEMPIPDFSDVNIFNYSHLPGTASASCKYKCSFCNDVLFRGPYRKRDIESVVQEMSTLSEGVALNYLKNGHQLFFMTDSLMNPVIDDLADQLIRRSVSLYYDGYYKVDRAAMDTENTMRWRKSGLYRVRLGVESGSQQVLNDMRKGITVEQIRGAVKGFALAGIKTTTYWVIGHPGETEKDFQMTLDLVEELRNYIYQAECNPFLYYYCGQNSSDGWERHRQLLYPAEAKKMLMFDWWTLDLEPRREIAYDRMNRFCEHCKKLGIPNPYTVKEIYDADRRWQKLQKFAVPPMDQFNPDNESIRDNLSERTIAEKHWEDDGDFNF